MKPHLKEKLLARLGVDAVAYGIGLLAGRIGSIILLPLYTFSLSVQEFGGLATLLVCMELLFILIHMSLRTVVLKYHGGELSLERMGELFGSSLAISVIAGLVVLALTLALGQKLGWLVPALQPFVRYLPWVWAAAFSHSTFVLLATYFRARQQPWRYMWSGLAATLLLTGFSVLLLTVLHQGIVGIFLSMVLAYGTMCLGMLGLLLRKHGLKICPRMVRQLTSFGLPLVPVHLSSVLTEAAILLLVTRFASLDSTALYNLSNRIIAIGMVLFIAPLQMAYEPFVFQNSDKPGFRADLTKIFYYLVLGFGMLAWGLVFFGRDIVRLVAPTAYGASFWIAMGLVPTIGLTGAYYYAEALLNARSKTRHLCGIVLVFTALSLASTACLVPWLGVWGAVIARNLVSLARTGYLLRVSLRLHDIQLGWRKNLVAATVFCFTAGLLMSLQTLSGWKYYSLALLVVAVGFAALWYCSGHETGPQQGCPQLQGDTTLQSLADRVS